MSSAKVETEQASGLDSAKLGISLVVLVGAIVAFYWYQDVAQTWVRVLGLLVAVGIAVAISARTRLGGMTWGFLVDSRTEVRKVVWPSRAETMQTTMLVIGMVAVVGILLWLLDMFLFWAVQHLTGQGS